MSSARARVLAPFTLLTLASLAGCAVPSEDDSQAAEPTAAAESGLTLQLPRPTGVDPGRLPVLDPGPLYAPPVGLPAYWDASSRTKDTVGLGWYERGTPLNPKTLVYRHRYDLDGHAIGTPTLIKTFTNLPKGNVGFVDSVATTDDHSGPDTDRLNCYHLVERTEDPCGPTPGGESCLSTPLACAYTRAATEHKVGRVQVRLKTSSASSAAASSDHVQVRLQSPYFPYALMPIPRNNNTWLDSTQHDFVSSSDVTYDVKTTNITDLSDITQITIATPDSDGLCINEIELLVDNTRAFFKSFGSDGVGCQEAWKSDALDGRLITVPFGELRRSPTWQAFSPPNLSFLSNMYTSFVGYRKDELISYLDAVFGDALRNPANGRGDDAGFRDTNWTTTSWVSARKLHVVQHVIAQDFGWQGSVAADPSYDLVIHNDATCGAKHWCIAVENVDANSSFSGWSSLIPIVGALIQAGVNSEANGQMQTAMTAMGGNALNDPPAGTEYCFPSRIQDTPFGSLGFDAGSLTLCLASSARTAPRELGAVAASRL